jgi:hypothetical protein
VHFWHACLEAHAIQQLLDTVKICSAADTLSNLVQGSTNNCAGCVLHTLVVTMCAQTAKASPA